MDNKLKKKMKQTEEAPLQMIPQLTDKIDPDVKVKKIKKQKLTATCELIKDKEKKKKKKEREIAEPPTDPAVTEKLKEDEMDGEGDLGPEERRVLERKMKKILKKEKIKLKADVMTEEQVEAFKPIAPQQALDYLTCWAEKRKDWKFQKTRQTWLLQHMFDSEKIPDQNFSVLLTYLEGLRGQARDTTVEKAEALVRELEEGADRMAQQRVHRAREVIQLLS